MAERLKHKRSLRGALTVMAMFALGGGVLWGLFHSQRATSPPSPQVPWGAPHRIVRFVSFDCHASGADDLRQTLDAIRRQDPDFVLLQQVPAGDVLSFVERLGMQQSYYTQLFQRTGSRGHDETGCLVLATCPLYEARGIQPDGRSGVCLGTSAVAEIDGVRFRVLSATAGAAELDAVVRAWLDAGSPPVVVGVGTGENGPAFTERRPADWVKAVADGAILADAQWFIAGDGQPAAGSAPFASAALSGLRSRASKTLGGTQQRPLRQATE